MGADPPPVETGQPSPSPADDSDLGWYVNPYGGSSRFGRRTAHRLRPSHPEAQQTARCGLKLGADPRLVDLVHDRGYVACERCAPADGPPQPAPAKPPPMPADELRMPLPTGRGVWYDPSTREEYFIDDVFRRGEDLQDAIRSGRSDDTESADPTLRPEWWADSGRSRFVHRTDPRDETKALCGETLRRPRVVNPYVRDWIACDSCVGLGQSS